MNGKLYDQQICYSAGPVASVHLNSKEEVMIIQCCLCKVVEGIKCPKCGVMQPNVVIRETTLCKCTCGHLFPAYEGGTSHGACQPCMDRELAKIPIKPNRAFELYNHGVEVAEL